MKKKNFVLTFIIAIAIMGTLSINITLLKNDLQYSLALENLMLRNIEALADGEGGTPGSMTEAEFAKLGCRATVNPNDRCKANNGYNYTFAVRI